MQNYQKWGSWNCICDICGLKRKSDDVRKNWQGLYVCADTCYEVRNPQDFIRGVEEKARPAFVRGEAADTYIAVCYIWDSSGYAGLAEAGCMLAGNSTSLTAAQLTNMKAGI